MSKKLGLLLVLAILIGGGSLFAQINFGAGFTLNNTEVKIGNTSVTSSTWSVPFFIGYRFSPNMGAGGEAQFVSTSSATYPMRFGGFFEYGLMTSGELSIWARAGAGYYQPGSGTNGFYLYGAPVIEYKVIDFMSLFFEVPIVQLAYASSAGGSELTFSIPFTQGITSLQFGVKFIF